MADLSNSLNDRDPVELLADEFAARCRRGESPSVSEYAARHPQHAIRIEELFPAVAMMERLRTEEKAKRRAALRLTGFGVPPKRIGDFSIVREIGRGGMGVVYEAEQRSLARRVALKVLPKHALPLDEDLRRFQREAQTAARLQHTNIIPVFGVGEQDGLHYYVMPLVRGVGLDEIIRQMRSVRRVSAAGSLPRIGPDTSIQSIHNIVHGLIAKKFAPRRPAALETQPDSSEQCGFAGETRGSSRSASEALRQSEASFGGNGASGPTGPNPGRGPRSLCANHWRFAARIAMQAAEALDYSHSQGALHRDIKPSNLLVDDTGLVCVADFGLARVVDHTEASRNGEVVGTLRYMAPEQLVGAADVRSDIYSLGLTLYELLTLQPAFEDARRRRVPHGRQAGLEPVPPRKIDPTIPRDLEAIALKCVAGEPSRRYPSASALAGDLRRFLEDKPIHARPVTLLERAWRWGRRNPALAVLSALAALLLVAVGATALTSYVQTTKAYAETTRALTRVEATSKLALEVLDDIYLQLSPDRIWILSDADGGRGACACLGLRSSAGSASSGKRAAIQVPPSEQTASLLKGLLVFYDRLAEPTSDDSDVMLRSAVASRRVGDIRQRLGQLDEAEREYAKAIEKLTALSGRPKGGEEVCVELARVYNELGNVRSARFESAPSYQCHRKAISILQSVEQKGGLSAEHRHELARTLYLLANKQIIELGDRRASDQAEDAAAPGPRHYNPRECRESAISILEQLTRENPNVPDYRFLLALCHRPPASDPTLATSSASARGRQRAIRILEELKMQYPEVDDYRYELIATYAWIHVGLFPWQRPSLVAPDAEKSLLTALEESQWLAAHNPSIPYYARSEALILAKLGAVYQGARRLAEAEDCFRRACRTLRVVLAGFPDLSAHHRVLLEFMRLRLAEVCYERNASAHDGAALRQSRDLLETCIQNLNQLAERPELAKDRLAWSSLPLAYDVLRRVLAETGENDKAEEAKKKGEAIARRMPDERKHKWWEY